jgi:hypothetical protein
MLFCRGIVVNVMVFARERAPAVLADQDEPTRIVRGDLGVQLPDSTKMVPSDACFLRLSVMRDIIAT